MKLSLAYKLLLLWLMASACSAAIEDHEFASPEQAQRYQQFTNELRCPQCLNASVAGSDAPIAADLRQEVYEQMQAGRTDEEIMAFMKERYGDFISYRPPLNSATWFLWFGPAALLLVGFFVLRRMLRSMRSFNTEVGLSAEEQQKLQRLTGNNGDTGA